MTRRGRPPQSGKPGRNPAAEALLASVANALKSAYPLKSDDEVLRAAKEAVGFQIDPSFAQALIEVFLKHPDVKKWGLELHGSANLILGPEGEERARLRFAAPKRIESCVNLDEVLSTATIFALLHSPLARAALHLHGYKLGFFTSKPESPTSSESETRH